MSDSVETYSTARSQIGSNPLNGERAARHNSDFASSSPWLPNYQQIRYAGLTGTLVYHPNLKLPRLCVDLISHLPHSSTSTVACLVKRLLLGIQYFVHRIDFLAAHVTVDFVLEQVAQNVIQNSC